MDFSHESELGDPMSTEGCEDSNVLRHPPPSNSDENHVQTRQQHDMITEKEVEMNSDLEPSDRFQTLSGPIIISTSRPTRESVLQRLSEALLRRSLTKVNNSMQMFNISLFFR